VVLGLCNKQQGHAWLCHVSVSTNKCNFDSHRSLRHNLCNQSKSDSGVRINTDRVIITRRYHNYIHITCDCVSHVNITKIKSNR